MVNHIGQHGKNQIAGRGRSQALEGNANTHSHQVAAAQTGNHAAKHTDCHTRKAKHLLAELVCQRNHHHGCNGHGDCTQHCQERLGSAIGIVQNILAEEHHRPILDGASPLEAQIEQNDNPPPLFAGNGFQLLPHGHGFHGCGFLLAHGFLGDPLPGEQELQIDGQGGEDGNRCHADEPAALVRRLIGQHIGNQDGEHHRASAHHAQTGHIGHGSQGAALAAVTGRQGNHGGVCGIVNGVSHSVIEIIGNGNPHIACRSLKGNHKHQHTGNGKSQCRQ